MSSCGASIRATVPRLPVEIQDEIIGYLEPSEDRSTLVACSLTCKSWLPKARSLIFRKIRCVLPAEDLTYLSQCAQFLREHKAVAAAIQEFGVLSRPLQTTLGDGLSSVVKLLPNLRQLHVDNFRLASALADGNEDPTAGKEDIALLQAISQCPRLEELELELEMRCERPYEASMFAPGSFSQLQTLRMNVNDTSVAGAILEAIALTQCTPGVPNQRHLEDITLPDIMDFDDPGFERFGSFFKTAGRFVKELDITLKDTQWERHGAEGMIAARKHVELMNIASCTNLKALLFILTTPDDPDSWPWLIILATLEAIPSKHHPAEVIIDFSPTSWSSEESSHRLHELNQVFDKSSSVKKVTFVPPPTWDDEERMQEYLDEVWDGLPNLTSRDLFEIEEY